MAGGIPIRLIQENGNTIELDATTMVLSTSRKVGGSAIPFTGSKRIGMDLNINKAMINIQGIIADDREGTKSTAHSATINFGQTGSGKQFNTADNLTKLLQYNLNLQTFETAVYSADKVISFTNTASAGATAYSSNGGAGSTPTVLVNTSDATPVQLTTAVVDYINNQYSSNFTATSVEGVDYNDATSNCVVNIVMTTLGKNSAMSRTTPIFRYKNSGTDAAFYISPLIQKFAGGSDGGKKSAGDKTMDLYGIINNSKRRGPVSDFFNRKNGRKDEVKDYIVGIQIPYNSTLKATGGDQYVARNFFMPTGNYDGLDKTSEGNDLPASVDFSMKEETTGIQGSVQKFDITYDAGESVYNFNMIFAPIDNLILS
tara:strand:- start:1096 stop:2211 length:1116 start_codon:yes stop_codon:yes gene_type:complete